MTFQLGMTVGYRRMHGIMIVLILVMVTLNLPLTFKTFVRLDSLLLYSGGHVFLALILRMGLLIRLILTLLPACTLICSHFIDRETSTAHCWSLIPRSCVCPCQPTIDAVSKLSGLSISSWRRTNVARDGPSEL